MPDCGSGGPGLWRIDRYRSCLCYRVFKDLAPCGANSKYASCSAGMSSPRYDDPGSRAPGAGRYPATAAGRAATAYAARANGGTRHARRPLAKRRDELVGSLDAYLDVRGIPDKPLNGRQVAGREEVTKVVAAVDPSLNTFEMAVAKG